MSDKLKVGVTDPVRDGGPGTGEKVVKNGNFVTEKHQSVDQVGSDESSTTSDCRQSPSRTLPLTENPLSLGCRQEFDGGEIVDGGVLDRVGFLVKG